MKGENSIIHDPFIALGATHRYFLSGMDFFRGVFRAHHGRNAEFTADDGGMTGPPPPVGDNSGSGFHHRLPIRCGRIGHKYLPGLKVREMRHIRNDMGFALSNLFPDSLTL